jgi:hypothetical protein
VKELQLALRDAGFERLAESLSHRLDSIREHVLEEAAQDEALRVGPW